MITGPNDHTQEYRDILVYEQVRSDCPSCYDNCSGHIGLILPNTVIGGGGAYPTLGSPTKYISLCSEPAFDLVTFIENSEFHNFDDDLCSDNFVFQALDHANDMTSAVSLKGITV